MDDITKNSVTDLIMTDLYSMRDEGYASFSSSLIPSVSSDRVIGVRVPALRKYAKNMPWDMALIFMSALPHSFLEEYELHAYLIDRIADFDSAVTSVEAVLPYVDNWAVCDGMRPKIFAANTDKLYEYVCKWIGSEHTYTVRYAIGMLCSYYLDSAFSAEHLSLVAAVKSDDYYVNMMAAWYFATAIVKQRETALAFVLCADLSDKVLSMTVRKSIESCRVSDEDKACLRMLKRK